MNGVELMGALVAALTLGGGGAWGTLRIVSRKAAAAQSKREKQLIEKLDQVQRELTRRRSSDPPMLLDDRRAAARAAGFQPGETGSFERANSMGDMRCNAHEKMATALEDMRSAAQASANAASMANATAMRLEETVRRENVATREVVEKLSNRFGTLTEWKGGVDARLTAVEREIGRVNIVRGGAAR